MILQRMFSKKEKKTYKCAELIQFEKKLLEAFFFFFFLLLLLLLIFCSQLVVAEIAQLGERQTEDLKVPGSISGELV